MVPGERGSEVAANPCLVGDRDRRRASTQVAGLANKFWDLVFRLHPWVLGGTIQDRLNQEPRNFLSEDVATDIVVRRLR
jgi:hypothetical protein